MRLDEGTQLDFEVKIASQAEMFGNRLRKNVRRLRSWVRSGGISCYRVYDRDIPEVPFAVDWYDGHLHIAEYARRSTSALSHEEHARWVESMVGAAAHSLGVSQESVFMKRRENKRGKSQYERVSRRGSSLVVTEGGHRFLVNLSDYLDTGLFLDHRKTRAIVESEAADRRVLNLFGYTGSFTVYAVAGGARSTTTVDLSRTYLSWTKTNFDLNSISTESGNHELVHDDARRFLGDVSRGSQQYDLIVVDPPTFSNSKRMSGSFDVQRDHVQLLRESIKLLSSCGVIYFSTNSRRFRLDDASLVNVNVEDISAETIPHDFRDHRVHKCYRIRRVHGRAS